MAWNKLSNYATTISRTDEGFTQIIYHSTVIVKWNDKQIILNNGGWHSATTKKKMNQASIQFNLGYNIHQKNYRWYINYKDETFEWNNSTFTLFRDI